MVDGVTEGEESVGGQADPGQLGEEGVFLLGRQGFRHLVEVRLPCRPLGRRDVALDVPSTHKAKKRRQTTRQQVKNKKQTKDTKKKEKNRGRGETRGRENRSGVSARGEETLAIVHAYS